MTAWNFIDELANSVIAFGWGGFYHRVESVRMQEPTSFCYIFASLGLDRVGVRSMLVHKCLRWTHGPFRSIKLKHAGLDFFHRVMRSLFDNKCSPYRSEFTVG